MYSPTQTACQVAKEFSSAQECHGSGMSWFTRFVSNAHRALVGLGTGWLSAIVQLVLARCTCCTDWVTPCIACLAPAVGLMELSFVTRSLIRQAVLSVLCGLVPLGCASPTGSPGGQTLASMCDGSTSSTSSATYSLWLAQHSLVHSDLRGNI